MMQVAGPHDVTARHEVAFPGRSDAFRAPFRAVPCRLVGGSVHSYFDVGSRSCTVDSLQDLASHRPNSRPTGRRQNDYCELPSREVLLVLEILVSGQEYIEAAGFCRSHQSTVLQRAPAQFDAVSTE
jgi:hypothetical protein